MALLLGCAPRLLTFFLDFMDGQDVDCWFEPIAGDSNVAKLGAYRHCDTAVSLATSSPAFLSGSDFAWRIGDCGFVLELLISPIVSSFRLPNAADSSD